MKQIINRKNEIFWCSDSSLANPDIGKGTKIWNFCNVQGEVGENCNICDGCYIESGVKIGNNCTIKNGVIIWDAAEIGDWVFVGPSVNFINELYPRCLDKITKEQFIKTKIGDGATIGANAVIVGGCHIGEHAFVGAGAVVTRPVEPFSMVVGNPAKHVKYICACREKFEQYATIRIENKTFSGLTTENVGLHDHLPNCEIYQKYLNSKK